MVLNLVRCFFYFEIFKHIDVVPLFENLKIKNFSTAIFKLIEVFTDTY